MHNHRTEQRFVFAQRHHDPRANPARVDKFPKSGMGAVELFLRSIRDPDDMLATRDAGQRPSREQVGWAFQSHRCDELRIRTQRHSMSLLALDPPYVSVRGLA